MKFWYDTDSAVALNDFSRPSEQVFDALTGRLRMCPKFKVARLVIQAVAVFVMDALIWIKRSAQFLFHHKPMFHNVFHRPNAHQHIAAVVYVSVSAAWRALHARSPTPRPCRGIPVPSPPFVVGAAPPPVRWLFVAPINLAFSAPPLFKKQREVVFAAKRALRTARALATNSFA